ncbi:high mobility group B protein 6 [Selaginella moellendorffii]|uniref:high mobility group B protein 6 n=1 Tax=Selaginella moellendorffii TaxID=88036 RepID=UPI000D1CA4AF|nr:high mobility group B protein 6 [Selaginella moellendorffii]|eukprot:XP_024528573.1 high mobility group B protein 6 [Selaginella moellendorffii]
MPTRRKAAAAAAAAQAPAPAMESNKENVAEGAGAPVPVSPPMRAAGKGLKSARNWEEELETMTQKLNKMRLEKEEVQKLVLEQGAKIKEQHDRIAMQSKEHEKLQEKIRKLEKVKEFQPNLSIPLPDESSDDSKGKKKKNDPERIKKPLSSYFLWCNDQREKVRAQNPNAGIKELSSIFGELWKSVSEEEKKPYEEIYQKNKEEYLKLVGKEKREAEALKLLQDEKNRKLSKEILDQFMEYKKEIQAQAKPKKKEKDPEKPKRPTTGYMAYSEERRPALMNENLKVPQIGKILGEEWRSMDEKARAPYEKIATDAKATYLTEMEAYNKKKAQEEVVAEQALKEKAKRDKVCGLELLKQKEKEDEVKKAMKAEKAPRKAKAKTAEPGKPKKAATAYILFGMEYRKKLQAEMPTAKFAELTALVASKWNEMGAEEKQPYVNQAGVEKLKYQEAMEEFKRLSPDPKDGATTSTT